MSLLLQVNVDPKSRDRFAASFLSAVARFSSCSHCRRSGPGRVNLSKKTADPDIQGRGQSFQDQDSDVLLAPFDSADVRPVDRRLKRKPFLRKASLDAQLAQIPTDEFAGVHDGAQGHIECLTIDGLSVPYSLQHVSPRNRTDASGGAHRIRVCRYSKELDDDRLY